MEKVRAMLTGYGPDPDRWPETHVVPNRFTLTLLDDTGCELAEFGYWAGPAIESTTPADVLACILSEVAGVLDADEDNETGFEDWCFELGMDTDSRKAWKAYQACCRQRDDVLDALAADPAELADVIAGARDAGDDDLIELAASMIEGGGR